MWVGLLVYYSCLDLNRLGENLGRKWTSEYEASSGKYSMFVLLEVNTDGVLHFAALIRSETVVGLDLSCCWCRCTPDLHTSVCTNSPNESNISGASNYRPWFWNVWHTPGDTCATSNRVHLGIHSEVGICHQWISSSLHLSTLTSPGPLKMAVWIWRPPSLIT